MTLGATTVHHLTFARLDAGGTPATAARPARHGPRLSPHLPRPRRPRGNHPAASSAATPAPSARPCATPSPTSMTRGWQSAPPKAPAPNAPPPLAARRRAIAGNWCAGAALHDDQLDVPGYRPHAPATARLPAPASPPTEVCIRGVPADHLVHRQNVRDRKTRYPAPANRCTGMA